jgi:hypothetical protein
MMLEMAMLTMLLPTSSVTSRRWGLLYNSWRSRASASPVAASWSTWSVDSEKMAISELEKKALNRSKTSVAPIPASVTVDEIIPTVRTEDLRAH